MHARPAAIACVTPMCSECHLNECNSWKEACLCQCHGQEYEPGYDEQITEDGDDDTEY